MGLYDGIEKTRQSLSWFFNDFSGIVTYLNRALSPMAEAINLISKSDVPGIFFGIFLSMEVKYVKYI